MPDLKIFFSRAALHVSIATSLLCAATGVQAQPTYSFGCVNNIHLSIIPFESFRAAMDALGYRDRRNFGHEYSIAEVPLLRADRVIG